jgi:hypothetical protein
MNEKEVFQKKEMTKNTEIGRSEKYIKKYRNGKILPFWIVEIFWIFRCSNKQNNHNIYFNELLCTKLQAN